MNHVVPPITAQEWERIPYLVRKRLYWLCRWEMFKYNLKKLFRMFVEVEADGEPFRKAMNISARNWRMLTLWDRRQLLLAVAWILFKSKIRKLFRAWLAQSKAFLQKHHEPTPNNQNIGGDRNK